MGLAIALLGVVSPSPLHASGDPASEYVTGRVGEKAILGIAPEWQASFDAYAPDENALKRIRGAAGRVGKELEVQVVFGSWCGDSLDGVPRYIKVMRLLGKDALKSTYIGVDRQKIDPKREVEGKDIQRVPTYIVYWRGIELGRIIETPKASIEADLASILEKPGQP